MENAVYEAKIFEMQVNPDTGKQTICLEVELDNSDFNEIKEHWVDNETVQISMRTTY